TRRVDQTFSLRSLLNSSDGNVAPRVSPEGFSARRWLPASAESIAHRLVGAALLALVADRWHENVLVEVHTHALDDLVIEEPVGLGLTAEHPPLAASPGFGLSIRGTLPIFQASELARSDHLGNP